MAAEGQRGMRRRIIAWGTKNSIDVAELPFAIVPCPIDLRSSDRDAKKLISLLKTAETESRLPVRFLIDTLSRSFGGGEENWSEHMGSFVEHIDRLAHASGAAIDIIHHTGKNLRRGARGHSLLKAAADVEFLIKKSEKTFTIRNTKRRDREEKGLVGQFRIENTEIGTGMTSAGGAVEVYAARWGRRS